MTGQVWDYICVRTRLKLKMAEYGPGTIHVGEALSSVLTLKLSIEFEEFDIENNQGWRPVL